MGDWRSDGLLEREAAAVAVSALKDGRKIESEEDGVLHGVEDAVGDGVAEGEVLELALRLGVSAPKLLDTALEEHTVGDIE